MEPEMIRQMVALAAGGICVVIGAVCIFTRRRRAACCTAQTGGVVSALISDVREIINHDDEADSSRYVTYHPQFTYSVNGQEYVKVSGTGSTNRRFKEGQAVTVLYDPADPNVYVVKEDKASAAFGWIFLLFGAAIVIFSFYVPYLPLNN